MSPARSIVRILIMVAWPPITERCPLVYSPGYLVKEKSAQVETNFYSTEKPDGELVWTGTTNTFDANSPMKVIKELIKVVIKELEKQSVIDQRS